MKAANRTRRKTRTRVENRGSTAVDVLEQAWDMLRAIDERIPEAVLVVVDCGSRRRKKGHFAWSTWKARGKRRAHEVAVNPVLFSRQVELLGTLLHEAAHASLFDEGRNGGLGSTSYYHSTVFRDRCIEFGLACEFLHTRYGWTLTKWPDRKRIPKRFRPVLQLLKTSMPAGAEGATVPERMGCKPPPPGRVRLACRCQPQRKIHAADSVARGGGILCCICKHEFQRRLCVNDQG